MSTFPRTWEKVSLRPLSSPAFFETVHVSPHGSIAWDEDIELCPDSIYLELTGKKPEDLFTRVAAVDLDA